MSLICPKCLSDMEEIEVQGVRVDRCLGCKGIWLDENELARIRGAAEDLPEGQAQDGGERRQQVSTYVCPRCHGAFETREFLAGSGLLIERCLSCRGIFLDFGELKAIKQLDSIKQRKLALQPIPEGQEQLKKFMEEMRRRENVGVAEGTSSFTSDGASGARVYLFQLLTGLPVEVENPRSRYPAITLTLLIINVAAFFLQLFQDDLSYLTTFAFIPADFFSGRNFLGLFTSMFLHGGLLHLAGNMYFLWLFGDNVEDRLSRGGYLALYLFSGLVASILHGLLTSEPNLPTLGASGAISGVMGAYLMLFPGRKMYQIFFFIQFKVSVAFYLLFWLGMQILFSSLAMAGVAWFAHIGGFLAGMLGLLLLNLVGAVRPESVEVRQAA